MVLWPVSFIITDLSALALLEVRIEGMPQIMKTKIFDSGL